MATGHFSDSRLAETVADDVLAGRFLWCEALGWLRWTGTRWSRATEETVAEAVRKYVLAQFSRADAAGDETGRLGWHPTLKANRQAAILRLAKGVVERDAADFDRHPDLLNTPGGVVDLRTGTIQPHDPDLLITKIARGNYVAALTHPDWHQALAALPEDVRAWFQVRVGQAITGLPTPDGVIVICQGNGENGKSAVLTDGLLPALGDYASPASPKLIAGRHEHSTERADLRGQRLIIAEELTEDRSLNATALKQISDVGEIKARYVHKDNMTFVASHTLLVTTNYIPTVNEVDHGTWRRLALLRFPFTFRKAWDVVSAESDRKGDPGLKPRLRAGADGQHDAIVTWAVEGARKFYRDGFPPLPDTVKADTGAWRMQSDRVLAFWEEMLFADPSSCVTTTDLFDAFNAWLKASGHHEWPKELFHSRFKQHEVTAQRRVVEHRPRTAEQPMSRPTGATRPLPDRPRVYSGVRFRLPANDHVPLRSDRSNGRLEDRKREGREDCLRSLDQLDQSCCSGGDEVLSCKLCPHSASYWKANLELPERPQTVSGT